MEKKNKGYIPAYVQIQNYILENTQNGTYGVDNASFAEKLLQKQEEMR